MPEVTANPSGSHLTPEPQGAVAEAIRGRPHCVDYTPGEPGNDPGADPHGRVDVVETAPARGHIGRIVVGSMLGGLVAALFLAGRGWSESAGGPQDGVEVATDLHTLLERAGERGPFVLAGHSAGGIYVLNFAHLYPEQVAGVVLLDSMHPQHYTKIDGWPTFYEMFRRASAVLPSLSRLGVGRAHVRVRVQRPARSGS